VKKNILVILMLRVFSTVSAWKQNKGKSSHIMLSLNKIELDSGEFIPITLDFKNTI